MGKVWVLDTETKGTGANVVPLEKVQRRPAADPEPAERRPKRRPAAKRPAAPKRSAGRRPEAERSATALPPGHVRKKATGELGKVQSVDPKAGTVTVRWLRSGASSTVLLSAVSRR
jgi:hypothetical protein